MIKKILYIFVFFSSFAFSAENIIIDSLMVRDDQIVLSYHVEKLLSEKGIQALKRGINSEVVHHLQLWRKKGFINPLEKEYLYSIKVGYDNWERKYRIVTESENRLTAHLETVEQMCSQIHDFPVSPVDDLEKNATYFISIRVTFQPISAESFNALSDIFSKNEGEGKKRKSGYFGVLVNLLGFGDKKFSIKSDDFVLTEQEKIRFVR